MITQRTEKSLWLKKAKSFFLAKLQLFIFIVYTFFLRSRQRCADTCMATCLTCFVKQHKHTTIRMDRENLVVNGYKEKKNTRSSATDSMLINHKAYLVDGQH